MFFYPDSLTKNKVNFSTSCHLLNTFLPYKKDYETPEFDKLKDYPPVPERVQKMAPGNPEEVVRRFCLSRNTVYEFSQPFKEKINVLFIGLNKMEITSAIRFMLQSKSTYKFNHLVVGDRNLKLIHPFNIESQASSMEELYEADPDSFILCYVFNGGDHRFTRGDTEYLNTLLGKVEDGKEIWTSHGIFLITKALQFVGEEHLAEILLRSEENNLKQVLSDIDTRIMAIEDKFSTEELHSLQLNRFIHLVDITLGRRNSSMGMEDLRALSDDEIAEGALDHLNEDDMKRKETHKKKKIHEKYSYFSLKEQGTRVEKEKQKTPKEYRVVVLGKTGTGKSATANSIMMSTDLFPVSGTAQSVTSTIQFETKTVKDGVDIQLIDTPSFFDTRRETDIFLELAKIFDLFLSGIDVFCVVLRATDRKMHDHELKSIRKIKKLFGAQVLKHSILVLTHAENVFTKDNPLDDYFKTICMRKEFLNFGNHVIGVDNKATSPYEKQYRSMFIIKHLIRVIEDNPDPYVNSKLQHLSVLPKLKNPIRSKSLSVETTPDDIHKEEMKARNDEQVQNTLDEVGKHILVKQAEAEEQAMGLKNNDDKEVELEVLSTEDIEECKECKMKEENVQNRREIKRTKIHNKYSYFSMVKYSQDETFKMHTPLNEIRVVLIGKTGTGKSATANSIIKKQIFPVSGAAQSLTKTIQCGKMFLGGTVVQLIDTPGIFDTRDEVDVEFEIAKIAEMCPSGIHAFCFITKATDHRYSKHEMETVKRLKKIFGEHVLTHSMLILTYGEDKFNKDNCLHDYIHNKEGHPQAFEIFVKEFGNHIIAIDNKECSPYEVSYRSNFIIDHLKRLIDDNKGKCYVHEAFQKSSSVNVFKYLHSRSVARTSKMSTDAKTEEIKLLSILSNDTEVCNLVESEVKLNENQDIKQHNVDQSKVKEERSTAMKEVEAKVREFVTHYISKLTRSELENMTKEKFKSIPHLAQEILQKSLSSDTREPLGNDKDFQEFVENYIRNRLERLKEILNKINICFPSDSMVICQTKGYTKICDVSPGDKLLSVGKDGFLVFEDVFMLGHADASSIHLYVKITTKSGCVLHISPDHLVHVNEVGNLRAAAHIKVGDTLLTLFDDSVAQSKVVGVNKILKQGAYCPHTIGGSIIVSGALASCYTALLQPAITHFLLLPVRILYDLLPPDLFKSVLLYNLQDGMPSVLSKYQGYFFKFVNILPSFLKK